jgi:hypothetical protein
MVVIFFGCFFFLYISLGVFTPLLAVGGGTMAKEL